MSYAKSETTIDGILTAARKMFLAKNYADVSMVDIAVTARVTKGALYHHFRSKEHLYVAMMLKFLGEYQQAAQVEVRKKESCRERLSHLMLFFFHLPRAERGIFKLVRRDINIFKNPVRNQLVRAYQSALPRQLETVIRDGIRDGEFSPVDPRLLSWLNVAMVEVIMSRYAESIFMDVNKTVEFVINLLFDGVGVKPAALRSNRKVTHAHTRRVKPTRVRISRRNGRTPAGLGAYRKKSHAVTLKTPRWRL